MGSSVALFLARHGLRVVMFEQAAEPFSGASRYNEGKIHLGFLYGADPTLNTARKLIPGGLAFPGLLHDLIGRDTRQFVTGHDDRYIIHRDSVANSEQIHRHAVNVAEIVSGHPLAGKYFIPLKGRLPHRMPASKLDAEYDAAQIVAGFEVPERSIATQPVADAFVDALEGTPEVIILTKHKVVRVLESRNERWQVETAGESGDAAVHGPFDAVVNALWEGRAEVDVTAGLPPPVNCTHRYRVSLFARSQSQVNLRSAVVSVGPFGDVKNYDGRNLYLSWYKAGLQAEGEDLVPPSPPVLDHKQKESIARNTLANLATIIPAIQGLGTKLEKVEVHGGWVYAAGTGPLDRVDSDLHRRDRIGIRRLGGYVSVDTGKYSVAPWLARELVDELVG
jgi:glycine/D-amino acid oxidase-like deaminating enzyme